MMQLFSQQFLFSLSSEAFAENQGVAGSRKRNLDSGGEEEEEISNNEEEISLGSVDTDDGSSDDGSDNDEDENDDDSNRDNSTGGASSANNNSNMSGLPKKMPPTGKTPAAASASTSASAPGSSPRAKIDHDVELLSHRMDKMKMKDAEKGCNLNCVYPHFWWTFSMDGVRFVKYEFLLWSSPPGAAVAKLSKCGKFLYFSNKIPDRFLSVDRLFKQYNGFLGG